MAATGKAIPANTGVARGRWGENAAVRFLKGKGYGIVERNSRPCRADRRLEIDIVAWDAGAKALVFVEVKQHARRVPGQRLLRSVDARKRRLLLRACKWWLATNRWTGAYRFDVVEVYGVPDGDAPEIDHVERVMLFGKPSRFVDWYS